MTPHLARASSRGCQPHLNSDPAGEGPSSSVRDLQRARCRGPDPGRGLAGKHSKRARETGDEKEKRKSTPQARSSKRTVDNGMTPLRIPERQELELEVGATVNEGSVFGAAVAVAGLDLALATDEAALGVGRGVLGVGVRRHRGAGLVEV